MSILTLLLHSLTKCCLYDKWSQYFCKYSIVFVQKKLKILYHTYIRATCTVKYGMVPCLNTHIIIVFLSLTIYLNKNNAKNVIGMKWPCFHFSIINIFLMYHVIHLNQKRVIVVSISIFQQTNFSLFFLISGKKFLLSKFFIYRQQYRTSTGMDFNCKCETFFS